MKIDIDFDELLNNAVNSAIDATVNLSGKNPDASGHAEQFERIAKISASVTVKILREYHAALENALSCVSQTDATTH